jgi:[acyl-carrier-protein] S-malonyltransferase
MAAAARAGGRPHGMLSVVGLGQPELEGLCREAVRKLGGGAVCVVANCLFPTVRGCLGRLGWLRVSLHGSPKTHLPHLLPSHLEKESPNINQPNPIKGRVVSGHADALDLVQAAALDRGALKAARLAVGGAFHTVRTRDCWTRQAARHRTLQ